MLWFIEIRSVVVCIWDFFAISRPYISILKGPKGVKWELGIAYFVLGKGRFHALGLGFIGKKTIERGSGIMISSKQPLGLIVHLDTGIWAGKCEKKPPSPPSQFRTCINWKWKVTGVILFEVMYPVMFPRWSSIGGVTGVFVILVSEFSLEKKKWN